MSHNAGGGGAVRKEGEGGEGRGEESRPGHQGDLFKAPPLTSHDLG